MGLEHLPSIHKVLGPTPSNTHTDTHTQKKKTVKKMKQNEQRCM